MVVVTKNKLISNATLVKVDKRLSCVEIRLLFDNEKSSLIPHEEKSNIPHARTLVIPHEESSLFPHAGKNGDPPMDRG